jgi:pimeloyl-ACP methyl ester carboxylesterase
LLFQGLQDPIAPPEHSSEILKKNYNGSLKVVDIPEASHALLPEAATEIITRTINYLKTI